MRGGRHPALLIVLIGHLAADDGKPVDLVERDATFSEDCLDGPRGKAREVLLSCEAFLLNGHANPAVFIETGGCVVPVVDSENSHISIAARDAPELRPAVRA